MAFAFTILVDFAEYVVVLVVVASINLLKIFNFHVSWQFALFLCVFTLFLGKFGGCIWLSNFFISYAL